jgi:uncharacterized membrane protein
MDSLVSPDNTWVLLAVIVSGAAASIALEQRYVWATKISGPVVALLLAMVAANLRLVPTNAPAYDVVEDYLVPLAVPLLLFRANLRTIWRETGSMFLAFHVAALGTVVGAFLAAFLFRQGFERVPEVAGIMTGSYIGGSVNFMAIKNTYEVSSTLANPLIVADNFIMAGMFAVLLILSGSRVLLRHYPHPHSEEAPGPARPLAGEHWRRKEIALLDIAKALAVAMVVVAAAMQLSRAVNAQVTSPLLLSVVANVYVWITVLTVAASTLLHRWMEAIHGPEELGVWLLYLFFFVIGLRADFLAALKNMPVLFVFCSVMAMANLIVTLLVGRLLKLNLEELLLGVNATLGGAPSAVAMAVSKGWSRLVLPGLLAGIWGYVIGTFIGILVAEVLKRVLPLGAPH